MPKRQAIPIGVLFGRWRVLSDAGYRKGHRYVNAECMCGTRREVRLSALVQGATQSCQRCTANNIVGQKFGRWTVESTKTKGKRRYVDAVCACGTRRSNIIFESLRSGTSRSCGCYNRDRKTVHGEGYGTTAEYRIWHSMKKRCLNPNDQNYTQYGGRGITVCAAWIDDYPQFLKDMGRRPSEKHSIDRINNDKGYYPQNCRWATSTQQNRNTRRAVLLTCRGTTKPLATWAEDTGIPYQTLYTRLHKGYPPTKILENIHDV